MTELNGNEKLFRLPDTMPARALLGTVAAVAD
jgi:hypothetical protein